MRVLIVEDNPDIVANLYAYLEPAGYRLDCARTGDSGLAAAAAGSYDAIVLDVMLPGLDGFELCRRLRKDLQQPTPVLMLTARDTIQDKIGGFESGADDYLVKPFSMAELDVRLKALVRRARDGHINRELCIDDLCFNTSTMAVKRGGRVIELTPTGYKLLARLMIDSPHVVSRESLERAVWGEHRPESDALRTHIHSLRQAIDKPFGTPLLRTIQGVGYQLASAAEGESNAS